MLEKYNIFCLFTPNCLFATNWVKARDSRQMCKPVYSGCSQLSQKVVKCSSFPTLVGKFCYQSSGGKSFIFPQVFDKSFV